MMPGPGSVWRHRKGNCYVVLGVALLESPITNVVVYQPVQGGQVWVRPLAAWEEMDGTGVARFSLLDNEEAREVLRRYSVAPRCAPFSPISAP